MLKGKEFCVVNGSSSLPKPALEKKIIECGGTIVQNPGRYLQCTLFKHNVTL